MKKALKTAAMAVAGGLSWLIVWTFVAAVLIFELLARLVWTVPGKRRGRRRATELAERLLPGELEVIHVSWEPFSGSDIRFRVLDDPDAAVGFKLKGRPGEYRDRALTDAVTASRSQATRLRLAITTFARCGYEVIAFDEHNGVPWVSAPPADDTIADLGECVRHWSQALAEAGMAPDHDLSVIVAAHGIPRPTPSHEHPLWMRMTDFKLRRALRKAPRHTMTYAVHDGIVDPASGTLRQGEQFPSAG